MNMKTDTTNICSKDLPFPVFTTEKNPVLDCNQQVSNVALERDYDASIFHENLDRWINEGGSGGVLDS